MSGDVNDEEYNEQSTLHLILEGKEMADVGGWFGSTDPFFQLLASTPTSSGSVIFQTVYTSEEVPQCLNPRWKKAQINLRDLCKGDINKPIRITVVDWEPSEKHNPMGHFDTTVADLLHVSGDASKTAPLRDKVNREEVDYGKLVVRLARIKTPRDTKLDNLSSHSRKSLRRSWRRRSTRSGSHRSTAGSHRSNRTNKGGRKDDVTSVHSRRSIRVVEPDFEFEHSDLLHLTLEARDLVDTVAGWFETTNPYFQISIPGDKKVGGKIMWQAVYRSEHLEDNLNPVWKEAEVMLYLLCGGDVDNSFRISVFSHVANSTSHPMGFIDTTLKELIKTSKAEDNKPFVLKDGKGEEFGKLAVLHAQLPDDFSEGSGSSISDPLPGDIIISKPEVKDESHQDRDDSIQGLRDSEWGNTPTASQPTKETIAKGTEYKGGPQEDHDDSSQQEPRDSMPWNVSIFSQIDALSADVRGSMYSFAEAVAGEEVAMEVRDSIYSLAGAVGGEDLSKSTLDQSEMSTKEAAEIDSARHGSPHTKETEKAEEQSPEKSNEKPDSHSTKQTGGSSRIQKTEKSKEDPPEASKKGQGDHSRRQTDRSLHSSKETEKTRSLEAKKKSDNNDSTRRDGRSLRTYDGDPRRSKDGSSYTQERDNSKKQSSGSPKKNVDDDSRRREGRSSHTSDGKSTGQEDRYSHSRETEKGKTQSPESTKQKSEDLSRRESRSSRSAANDSREGSGKYTNDSRASKLPDRLQSTSDDVPQPRDSLASYSRSVRGLRKTMAQNIPPTAVRPAVLHGRKNDSSVAHPKANNMHEAHSRSGGESQGTEPCDGSSTLMGVDGATMRQPDDSFDQSNREADQSKEVPKDQATFSHASPTTYGNENAMRTRQGSVAQNAPSADHTGLQGRKSDSSSSQPDVDSKKEDPLHSLTGEGGNSSHLDHSGISLLVGGDEATKEQSGHSSRPSSTKAVHQPQEDAAPAVPIDRAWTQPFPAEGDPGQPSSAAPLKSSPSKQDPGKGRESKIESASPVEASQSAPSHPQKRAPRRSMPGALLAHLKRQRSVESATATKPETTLPDHSLQDIQKLTLHSDNESKATLKPDATLEEHQGKNPQIKTPRPPGAAVQATTQGREVSTQRPDIDSKQESFSRPPIEEELQRRSSSFLAHSGISVLGGDEAAKQQSDHSSTPSSSKVAPQPQEDFAPDMSNDQALSQPFPGDSPSKQDLGEGRESKIDSTSPAAATQSYKSAPRRSMGGTLFAHLRRQKSVEHATASKPGVTSPVHSLHGSQKLNVHSDQEAEAKQKSGLPQARSQQAVQSIHHLSSSPKVLGSGEEIVFESSSLSSNQNTLQFNADIKPSSEVQHKEKTQPSDQSKEWSPSQGIPSGKDLSKREQRADQSESKSQVGGPRGAEVREAGDGSFMNDKKSSSTIEKRSFDEGAEQPALKASSNQNSSGPGRHSKPTDSEKQSNLEDELLSMQLRNPSTTTESGPVRGVGGGSDLVEGAVLETKHESQHRNKEDPTVEGSLPPRNLMVNSSIAPAPTSELNDGGLASIDVDDSETNKRRDEYSRAHNFDLDRAPASGSGISIISLPSTEDFYLPSDQDESSSTYSYGDDLEGRQGQSNHRAAAPVVDGFSSASSHEISLPIDDASHSLEDGKRSKSSSGGISNEKLVVSDSTMMSENSCNASENSAEAKDGGVLSLPPPQVLETANSSEETAPQPPVTGGIGHKSISSSVASSSRVNSGAATADNATLHLRLAGKELAKMGGWFGSTNALFQVSCSVDAAGADDLWQSVYESECIENSLDPEWKEADIDLGMLCGDNPHQKNLFSLFHLGDGKRTSMGSFHATVNQLLESRNLGSTFSLSSDDGTENGMLFVKDVRVERAIGPNYDPKEVKVEAPSQRGPMFVLGLQGQNIVIDKGWFTATNLQYQVMASTRTFDGSQIWRRTVYSSEHVAGDLNPAWAQAEINLSRLCGGEFEKPILVSIFDRDEGGRDTPLGSLETTVSQLVKAASSYESDTSNSLVVENDGIEIGRLLVLKALVNSPDSSPQPKALTSAHHEQESKNSTEKAFVNSLDTLPEPKASTSAHHTQKTADALLPSLGIVGAAAVVPGDSDAFGGCEGASGMDALGSVTDVPLPAQAEKSSSFAAIDSMIPQDQVELDKLTRARDALRMSVVKSEAQNEHEMISNLKAKDHDGDPSRLLQVSRKQLMDQKVLLEKNAQEKKTLLDYSKTLAEKVSKLEEEVEDMDALLSSASAKMDHLLTEKRSIEVGWAHSVKQVNELTKEKEKQEESLIDAKAEILSFKRDLDRAQSKISEIEKRNKEMEVTLGDGVLPAKSLQEMDTQGDDNVQETTNTNQLSQEPVSQAEDAGAKQGGNLSEAESKEASDGESDQNQCEGRSVPEADQAQTLVEEEQNVREGASDVPVQDFDMAQGEQALRNGSNVAADAGAMSVSEDPNARVNEEDTRAANETIAALTADKGVLTQMVTALDQRVEDLEQEAHDRLVADSQLVASSAARNSMLDRRTLEVSLAEAEFKVQSYAAAMLVEGQKLKALVREKKVLIEKVANFKRVAENNLKTVNEAKSLLARYKADRRKQQQQKTELTKALEEMKVLAEARQREVEKSQKKVMELETSVDKRTKLIDKAKQQMKNLKSEKSNLQSEIADMKQLRSSTHEGQGVGNSAGQDGAGDTDKVSAANPHESAGAAVPLLTDTSKMPPLDSDETISSSDSTVVAGTSAATSIEGHGTDEQPQKTGTGPTPWGMEREALINRIRELESYYTQAMVERQTAVTAKALYEGFWKDAKIKLAKREQAATTNEAPGPAPPTFNTQVGNEAHVVVAGYQGPQKSLQEASRRAEGAVEPDVAPKVVGASAKPQAIEQNEMFGDVQSAPDILNTSHESDDRKSVSENGLVRWAASARAPEGKKDRMDSVANTSESQSDLRKSLTEEGCVKWATSFKAKEEKQNTLELFGTFRSISSESKQATKAETVDPSNMLSKAGFRNNLLDEAKEGKQKTHPKDGIAKWATWFSATKKKKEDTADPSDVLNKADLRKSLVDSGCVSWAAGIQAKESHQDGFGGVIKYATTGSQQSSSSKKIPSLPEATAADGDAQTGMMRWATSKAPATPANDAPKLNEGAVEQNAKSQKKLKTQQSKDSGRNATPGKKANDNKTKAAEDLPEILDKGEKGLERKPKIRESKRVKGGRKESGSKPKDREDVVQTQDGEAKKRRRSSNRERKPSLKERGRRTSRGGRKSRRISSKRASIKGGRRESSSSRSRSRSISVPSRASPSPLKGLSPLPVEVSQVERNTLRRTSYRADRVRASDIARRQLANRATFGTNKDELGESNGDQKQEENLKEEPIENEEAEATATEANDASEELDRTSPVLAMNDGSGKLQESRKASWFGVLSTPKKKPGVLSVKKEEIASIPSLPQVDEDGEEDEESTPRKSKSSRSWFTPKKQPEVLSVKKEEIASIPALPQVDEDGEDEEEERTPRKSKSSGSWFSWGKEEETDSVEQPQESEQKEGVSEGNNKDSAETEEGGEEEESKLSGSEQKEGAPKRESSAQLHRVVRHRRTVSSTARNRRNRMSESSRGDHSVASKSMDASIQSLEQKYEARRAKRHSRGKRPKKEEEAKKGDDKERLKQRYSRRDRLKREKEEEES